MELGHGSFGTVTRSGNRAVKKFKLLRHLLQEVILTRYMNDSPHTISCLKYDLKGLTMEMPLYDNSLRDVIINNTYSDQQRLNLFQDILMGACHLHSRSIIHSDLKPSNILVRDRDLSCVICDLGLSSTARFAKIKQTSLGYRLPNNLISHDIGEIHDHYGLAIIGLELLGRIKMTSAVVPEDLREYITEKIHDPTIRECLIGFTYVDRTHPDYRSVRQALIKIYNKDGVTFFPPLRNVKDVMSSEDSEYFYKDMKNLGTVYRIRRGKLGYHVLKKRINDTSYPKVPRKEYPLYIVCMLMILSAIFWHGKSIFNEEKALSAVNNVWSHTDLYRVLRDLIDKPDLMNSLLSPA